MRMKKWKKRVFSVLLCLILLMTLVPADIFAASIFEPDRKGSIAVTLKDLGTPMDGTVFELYQVGRLTTGTQMAFTLTGAFAGSGIDLNTLHKAADQKAAAETFAAMIPASPDAQTTSGQSGTMKFTNLDMGVYLIRQSQQGVYGEVAPYLVYLPYTSQDGSSWLYDIETEPKGEKSSFAVEILKVDEAGNALAGATLAVYDMAGVLIEEWESTGAAHVLGKPLMKNTDYVLKELKAPAGYLLAEAVVFSTGAGTETVRVTMKDIKRSDEYSVRVKKYVKYFDNYRTMTYSFYAALFWDKDCTQRATDVVELKLEESYSTTAVFEKLAAGTYYLAETDQDGNPLDVTSATAIFTNEITNDGLIELTPQQATANTTIVNHLKDPGDGPLDEGQITLNKSVVADGEKTKVTDTFYFTLFADEEMETIITTKSLSLKDQSGGKVTFENLAYGPYYLAETDQDGVPVDEDNFKYVVSVDKETIVLTRKERTAEVNVINDIGEKTTDTETETETKKPPAKLTTKNTITTRTVRTGDHTTVVLYVVTLLGAAALLGAVIYKKYKDKKANG